MNENGLKPRFKHSATVRFDPLCIAQIRGVSPPRVYASNNIPGLVIKAATISCLPAAHA